MKKSIDQQIKEVIGVFDEVLEDMGMRADIIAITPGLTGSDHSVRIKSPPEIVARHIYEILTDYDESDAVVKHLMRIVSESVSDDVKQNVVLRHLVKDIKVTVPEPAKKKPAPKRKTKK